MFQTQITMYVLAQAYRQHIATRFAIAVSKTQMTHCQGDSNTKVS